jgi:hypothetical protein
MAPKKQKTDKLAQAAWTLAGAKTLVAGVAFWGFIASQVVISGPVALAVFGTMASSSAVGIGGMVGYCAKKAQES